MSNTIDQQFVEFIVKSLVGNPDAVIVARSVDEKAHVEMQMLGLLCTRGNRMDVEIENRRILARHVRGKRIARGIVDRADPRRRYAMRIVTIGSATGRR